MDRIDVSGFFSPLISGGVKPETKKAKEKKPLKSEEGGRFERLLEEAASSEELGPPPEFAPSGETVQSLLDNVHSAGDALRERPFKEEILAYKRAVRDFLHYVVENSYDITQSQGIRRRKREARPYIHIQVVDQKLEQLAAGILSGQSSQLELLSRLEEIRGLLVDLVITGDWKGEGGKGET